MNVSTAAKRVLIVDDDEGIRCLVSTVLSRSGYLVETADSGSEGLAKIALIHYDAMLLDLMMPKMSGFDVLVELRTSRNRPAAVIVMSAAPRDVIAGARCSDVFATLQKPFDIDLLVTSVAAAILARPIAALSESRCVGGVRDEVEVRPVGTETSKKTRFTF
jgi:DNA-binding response OmpR family regulator